MPDVHYSIGHYRFIWDENKNLKNIARHGINFKTAAHVFNDSLRIEVIDENHSENEPRFDTIGLVEQVLFVVYCDQDIYDISSEIRFISARPATKKEIQLYNELSIGRK